MRNATPRALVRAQRSLESFCIAPDGEHLVFALRAVQRDRYVSHLWIVPWRGGRPRRLTSGFVRDASPSISPAGDAVAFTRAPAGDDAPEGQVWILPLSGREAWQLTHLAHGASAPRWSPDGRRLAVLGPAGEDRFRVGPERKGHAPRARHITRTDFRDDESGFLGRRTHLWAISAREGARARQLTHGDFDVGRQRWAPDGRWLAFVADPGPDANISPHSRVFRIPVGGGGAKELLALRGDADWPAISPDGRQLAVIGTDVDDPPDEVLEALFVAPVEGGRARNLTAELDRPIADAAWADLVMAEDDLGPVWLDGETLLTIASDRGHNLPYRVSAEGSCKPLADDAQVVCGGVTAARPDRIAISAGGGGLAADLHASTRRGAGCAA
jgi:dipeptidyl aminopeptidase/acylaminoacyl peptidase